MKEISSMDTLSGKEGRAYAKLNGNIVSIFNALIFTCYSPPKQAFQINEISFMSPY